MIGDKARIWPGEIEAGRDDRTGARVWQITRHRSINHHLYFLTSSFLPDERSLIFASYRNGMANFYRAGFPAGNIVQLTDSAGINGFSAVISSDGSRLLFTRQSCIVVIDMNTLVERQIADFPGGRLGEVDLSSDGKWVVSAIRFERDFGVVVAAVEGGEARIIHRQPDVVIHPQFHPRDPEIIEFATDPAPRMNLIRRDGTGRRCLYQHGTEEWLVHETWLAETGDLVFTVWPKAIKRMRMPSGKIETIAEFNAWHICPSPDGQFILCDTNCPDNGIQLVEIATGKRRTVCLSRSSNGGSQWPKGRVAVKKDFEDAARTAGSRVKDEMAWTDMKTDTVYGPQWTHPHPAFSRSGRYATFTSDRTDDPQVYVVEIKTDSE